MKKALDIHRKSKVERVWDKDDLDLDEGPITQIVVFNCFRNIGDKPITHENDFTLRKQT